MQVRMTRHYWHSPDGIQIDFLQSGQKYDLPDMVGRALVDQGAAIEDKDIVAAPEVKDAPPAKRKTRRRK